MDRKTRYAEKLLRPRYAEDYITDSDASGDEVAPPTTPPKNWIRKQYEDMYKAQGESVPPDEYNDKTISMLSSEPLHENLVTSEDAKETSESQPPKKKKYTDVDTRMGDEEETTSLKEDDPPKSR